MVLLACIEESGSIAAPYASGAGRATLICDRAVEELSRELKNRGFGICCEGAEDQKPDLAETERKRGAWRREQICSRRR